MSTGRKRTRNWAAIAGGGLMAVAAVGLMAVELAVALAPQLVPESLRENQSVVDVGMFVLFGGALLLALSLMSSMVAPIWRDSWRSRKMQDPVQGQALVVSVSGASGNAVSQNYTMTCVVSGPGLAATTVEHQGMAKTSQFPMPGATLPVTVDRADPTRLKILWDQVPTGHERGLAQAQALAAQMRSGASASTGGVPAGSPIVVQGLSVGGGSILSSDGTASQIVIRPSRAGNSGPRAHGTVSEIVIRANPDSAGAAAAVRDLLAKSGIPGAPEVSSYGGSPAQRLAELDDLHAKGLLTDDEYGEQRGRIIGSI